MVFELVLSGLISVIKFELVGLGLPLLGSVGLDCLSLAPGSRLGVMGFVLGFLLAGVDSLTTLSLCFFATRQ